MMKPIKTAVLPLVAMLALNGCASFFNIDGDERFGCGNRTGNVSCSNVLAAYHETEGYDPEDQMLAQGETGKKRWWQWGKKRMPRGVSPFYPEPIQSLASDNEAKPLMMPAQVMSVWVNSYEDEKGNLVYPTRVFSEISERKWDTGYRLGGSDKNKLLRVTLLVSNQTAPPDFDQQQTANHSAEAAASQVQNVQEQKQQPQGNANQNSEIPSSLPPGLIPPLK